MGLIASSLALATMEQGGGAQGSGCPFLATSEPALTVRGEMPRRRGRAKRAVCWVAGRGLAKR